MKFSKCLAIIMVMCSYFAFAQVDKQTLKIEALYKDNKFEEIIKYKKHRTKKLPSKVLYYKGLSYLQQEDMSNALKMFDYAINKGSADIDVYYQKSILHAEKKQYKKAIATINEALIIDNDNPDLHSLKGEIYYYKEDNDSALISLFRAIKFEGCDPKAFILIAEIKKEKKEFKEAFEYYKKALSMVDTKSDYHNFCSFSLGFMQQELKNFEEAKKLFQSHLELYADDYDGVKNLIQVNTTLGYFDENKALRKTLYDAYDCKKLPKKMKKSFCYEIFTWKDYTIYANDYFNPNDDKVNLAKYKYVMYDEKDEAVLRVHAELDSLKKDSTLTIKLIRKDTCYTYNNLKFNYNPDFKQLTSTIKELIENKHIPSDTLAAYGVWCDKIKMKNSSLANLSRDGSSFEKAIIIGSIPKEYEWLREYYPGYSFRMQSLVFNEGKPYDILKIESVDGVIKEVYFDISSFFGKGF